MLDPEVFQVREEQLEQVVHVDQVEKLAQQDSLGLLEIRVSKVYQD